MAIISSFLCWSNTRTGSAVCGYYTLVISVICLAFYMLRYIALDEMKESIELKGIVYAGFVLYSFLIGVSLILLPGVYMDRKYLLLPWIYVLVITVLYETGAIALITTVHLEQDHTLDVWEIVAVAFYCVRLIANCYSFACVVSQYQELSEGRGTYEFVFKPRRRQMARNALMFDLEDYNPPYGATLPPYSEENPYKEFCPPDYENTTSDLENEEYYSRSIANQSPANQSPANTDRFRNSRNLSYFTHESRRDQQCLDYNREINNESDYCYTYDLSGSHFYCMNESSEDIVDSSNNLTASELDVNCEHASDNSQPCGFSRSRHEGSNSPFSELGIAMTSSSASLMDTSPHYISRSPRYSRPVQSKRACISPLTIQKRTYITWI